MHNLIAKWAPPNEKGKFVATLLGGTFGTVVTWVRVYEEIYRIVSLK